MQVWESLGGAGDLVQQCHSGISGPVRYVLPGKERSDRATERLKGATGMTFRSLLRTGTGLALVVLLARGRAPDTWILGGFIGAFLIQWLFDHQTPDVPSRYPILSTAVTGAAGVSLALALEKAMNG